MKKLLLLAIVVLGISTVSFGQSESQAATATATLITPISILKSADLNFGTVASSNTAGTAVITPAGGASRTDGVTLMSGGATRTAASFTVSGEGTNGITVSYPTSIVLAGTTTPANTLTVNTINAASAAGTAITSGGNIPLISGALTINVGGTLVVPANTPKDVYVNTTALKVTVNYQ